VNEPDGIPGSVADTPARDVLLALADDEICMGHWYATWIGLAPFLEEDLAATSIGQDELGHARALYALLDPGHDGDDIRLDALVYGRPPEAYRCAWLVEDPCPTWEELFVRHLLYDEAEAVRWQSLRASSLPGLGSLAERALVEEAYHTRHARSLFGRLAQGGPEARGRMEAALARLVPLAAELFEPTEHEPAALAAGVLGASSAEQYGAWRAQLDGLAEGAGLVLRWPPRAPSAGDAPRGRRGVRSPGFADLHAEMTGVYALDPSARW
jgi:ring-1,2-phenylacetyl-CoA epoxidase subunit PaaC